MLNLTGDKIQKQTLTGGITVKGSEASLLKGELTTGSSEHRGLRGSVIQRGLDGYSPTVEFEETELGIKVTITDAIGPHSFIIEPGPKGDRGDPGNPGKSAYQYAKDGGYEGTEEEFAERMAADCVKKTDIPTSYDTLYLVAESGLIGFITDGNGDIITDENGDIAVF